VRRGLKLAAGLAVVMLVAGCMTVPEDARLAGLGADALEAGDYAAAEQHLTKALRVNPTNEHALLNLGVVYHNTDRPELARKTYAEIVRLNRAESEKVPGVVGSKGTSASMLLRILQKRSRKAFVCAWPRMRTARRVAS